LRSGRDTKGALIEKAAVERNQELGKAIKLGYFRTVASSFVCGAAAVIAEDR
jgi:hypothetical protein